MILAISRTKEPVPRPGASGAASLGRRTFASLQFCRLGLRRRSAASVRRSFFAWRISEFACDDVPRVWREGNAIPTLSRRFRRRGSRLNPFEARRSWLSCFSRPPSRRPRRARRQGMRARRRRHRLGSRAPTHKFRARPAPGRHRDRRARPPRSRAPSLLFGNSWPRHFRSQALVPWNRAKSATRRPGVGGRAPQLRRDS